MNNNSIKPWRYLSLFLFLVATVAVSISAFAQIPQAGNGNQSVAVNTTADPGGAVDNQATFSEAGLQGLVGPIALYSDDLVAIVLPASTYPLQIVMAARFLEQLETDSSLEPDENWDESIIALLNYPEVVQMMDENIDWTWQLGEAVIDQESDVLNAIYEFRTLAYEAGNLNSDDYQNVERTTETITITQVEEKTVYVPYYVPEEVIVYQTRPVYHYYPTPYPVYYYPYDYGYRFNAGFFWGVTTVFTLGWSDRHLRVYHPSYFRHPYFGRRYDNRYRYRRPTINVFNNYYVDNHRRAARNRTREGAFWRPQINSGSRPRNVRNRNVQNRLFVDGSRNNRSPSVDRRANRRLNSATDPRNNRQNIRNNRDRRATTAANTRNSGNFRNSSAQRDNRTRRPLRENQVTNAFTGSNRLSTDRPRSRRVTNAAPDATNNSARRRNDLARPQRNTNSIAASDSRRTSINRDIARSIRNRNSAGARQANSIPQSNARLNSGRRQTSVAQTAQINRRAPGSTERVRNNPNRNTRATTAPSRNREMRQAPARQRTAPQNRRAAPARPTAQRQARPSSRNVRPSSNARNTRARSRPSTTNQRRNGAGSRRVR